LVFFSKDQLVYLVLNRTNWFFGKINFLMLVAAYVRARFLLLWMALPKAGHNKQL
jgi:hypothetical protein